MQSSRAGDTSRLKADCRESSIPFNNAPALPARRRSAEFLTRGAVADGLERGHHKSYRGLSAPVQKVGPPQNNPTKPPRRGRCAGCTRPEHGRSDMSISLIVNGIASTVDIEPDTPLLWVL